MKKSEVLEFFGGAKRTAQALDITDSAVRMWSDDLSDGQASKVYVAAMREKGAQTAQRMWPEMLKSIAS